MRFAIVLAFSSLLGVSLAGETTTSDQGSNSNGFMKADDVHALESPMHANYESMSNRKLWRELIKKRNQLETAQRQWQHLLNLRQERMNKLSGKPLKHKIPSNGIPPEVIRQIEEILTYMPMDYEFYESGDDLEDKSEVSFSRNSQGSLYQEWGSGSSRHQHGGYHQQGPDGTSLNQRLTPKIRPDVSSPVEGSTYPQTRVSHQTKQPQRLTQGQLQGVAPHIKSGVYSPGDVSSPVEGSTYPQTRVSHQTKQPQRLTQGQLQGVAPHVKSGVYSPGDVSSPVEGSTYPQTRVSHQTKQPQRLTQGQLQGVAPHVNSGVYPPVEGRLNDLSRTSHEITQPQGLPSHVQSALYSPGEGSRYSPGKGNSYVNPRINHETKQPQELSSLIQSGVGPSGEGSNVQLRMSRETDQEQVYPPGKGTIHLEPRITDQTYKPQVYLPNERRTYNQPKINLQTTNSQGLASQAQSGVYLNEGNTNVQPIAGRESQPMSFGHPQAGVNSSEASINSNKVQGRAYPSIQRHFDSDDDFSDTPLVIY